MTTKPTQAKIKPSKLHFVFSSMNAGKSLSLLARAHALETRGFDVILAQSKIGAREQGKITSRIGVSKDCIDISCDGFLSDMIGGSPDFIFVDEAQFLSSEQIKDIANNIVDDRNITVFCYGIKLNLRGELFPGSAALFQYADEINSLESIGSDGRVAMNHYKFEGDSEKVIDIGDENQYQVMSRKQWRSKIEQRD